jgi:hypothetical protein
MDIFMSAAQAIVDSLKQHLRKDLLSSSFSKFLESSRIKEVR